MQGYQIHPIYAYLPCAKFKCSYHRQCNINAEWLVPASRPWRRLPKSKRNSCGNARARLLRLGLQNWPQRWGQPQLPPKMHYDVELRQVRSA